MASPRRRRLRKLVRSRTTAPAAPATTPVEKEMKTPEKEKKEKKGVVKKVLDKLKED